LKEERKEINSRAGLNPDIERGTLISSAVISRVTARAGLVDVVLDNSCPDHGGGTGEETECDLLKRAKVDAGTAESRIELGSARSAQEARKIATNHSRADRREE
jgi:hypothetical protein